MKKKISRNRRKKNSNNNLNHQRSRSSSRNRLKFRLPLLLITTKAIATIWKSMDTIECNPILRIMTWKPVEIIPDTNLTPPPLLPVWMTAKKCFGKTTFTNLLSTAPTVTELMPFLRCMESLSLLPFWAILFTDRRIKNRKKNPVTKVQII